MTNTKGLGNIKMSIWLLTFKKLSQTKNNIAAKKISQKYKKMRNKRSPIPFNLATLAETDSVTYANDTDLEDVSSRKSTAISAKKISQKYKKMRSKKQSLPFNLSDIANTETVDYNDDTNLQDTNMDRTAVLTAKKISEKYRKILKKRKRVKSPKPIEGEVERPKTSSSLSSKSARIAAKKISGK